MERKYMPRDPLLNNGFFDIFSSKGFQKYLPTEPWLVRPIYHTLNPINSMPYLNYEQLKIFSHNHRYFSLNLGLTATLIVPLDSTSLPGKPNGEKYALLSPGSKTRHPFYMMSQLLQIQPALAKQFNVKLDEKLQNVLNDISQAFVKCSDIFKLNSKDKETQAQGLFNYYKAQQMAIFNVSCKIADSRHVIGLTFYKNNLVLTDRGDSGYQGRPNHYFWRNTPYFYGSVIYPIQPNLVTQDWIREALETKEVGEFEKHMRILIPDYKADGTIHAANPNLVKFKQSPQKWPNCGFANLKSLIQPLSYLLLKEQGFSEDKAHENAYTIHKHTTQIFKRYSIEQLLQRSNDHNLLKPMNAYPDRYNQTIILHYVFTLTTKGHLKDYEIEAIPKLIDNLNEADLKLLNEMLKEYFKEHKGYTFKQMIVYSNSNSIARSDIPVFHTWKEKFKKQKYNPKKDAANKIFIRNLIHSRLENLQKQSKPDLN